MLLTLEVLKKIPEDDIFKVVTTSLQNFHKPLEVRLTFVCVKGGGGDWCMYAGMAGTDPKLIAREGDKVTSEHTIKSICPCNAEAFARYRM